MGNQRTTLSLAGAMDVHTFGKLKAAMNVVQSNGQLAQGSSFQGFQGRRSQSWGSPHSTILCTGQGLHAGMQTVTGEQHCSSTDRALTWRSASGSL